MNLLFLCLVILFGHIFCRRNKRGVVIVYDSSVARKQAFPEQPIEKMVDIYRALGEPSRLQILRILQERSLTTQSLAQICHLSEGAVSRHLQVLKRRI